MGIYATDALDRATNYGVRMVESLDSTQIKELHAVKRTQTVELGDPRLARIVRLRLVGFNSREYPRWDVSYCFGVLKDGTEVRVQVYGNIGRNWKGDLVAIAR